jgi:hypothetical protein
MRLICTGIDINPRMHEGKFVSGEALVTVNPIHRASLDNVRNQTLLERKIVSNAEPLSTRMSGCLTFYGCGLASTMIDAHRWHVTTIEYFDSTSIGLLVGTFETCRDI